MLFDLVLKRPAVEMYNLTLCAIPLHHNCTPYAPVKVDVPLANFYGLFM